MFIKLWPHQVVSPLIKPKFYFSESTAMNKRIPLSLVVIGYIIFLELVQSFSSVKCLSPNKFDFCEEKAFRKVENIKVLIKSVLIVILSSGKN